VRLLTCAALLQLFSGVGPALAAVETIAVVHSASAGYSTTAKHTIVVRAKVDLPNSCWANPRFKAPDPSLKPDAHGVVPITIIADSSEGAGVMCSMIYRPGVRVPALHWTTYPPTQLKAVKVIGSKVPIIAMIARTDEVGS
jgi:hypothetical protein